MFFCRADATDADDIDIARVEDILPPPRRRRSAVVTPFA